MFDILKWAWDELAKLFVHAEVSAGAWAMLLGVAMTDFVARILPPTMDATYAYRVVRLAVFGVCTCAAFALNPTVLGLIVALIAGTAAPAIQVLLMRAIYARWPAMKPAALVCTPEDRPPPPPLVKP